MCIRDREIESRYSRLTDEDYCRVAAELGIEPAVLHAVVDIEAGKEHRGFASPGVPVINFDRGIFTGMLKKRGVSVKGHAGSAALRPVDTRRYGNYSRAQWARLDAAREIDRDLPLIVAVQPTRGLDVGAIEYIHSQLVAQRDAGKAVLLVSLELDEVMSLSDRILVMYEGEIVGELDPKKTTVEELGLYMAGAKREVVDP